MPYANIMIFILFLLLHLLSQTLLKTPKQKNVALLLSSLVFYFWAGPLYMLLLVVLCLVYWFMGLLILRKKEKKYILIPAVISVALFVLTKYTTVLLSGMQNLFGVPEELPSMVVPLGIAFTTLNLISYLVDIWREDSPAETSFLNFLTYGTLFHLTLGGPVVRYKDIRRELSQRNVRPQDVSTGITRFSIGLFKRMLLADALAPVEDALLVRSAEGLAAVPVVGIILGVLISSLRLYITLSAYADMAIGLGRISGFRYNENFNYPLLSCTMRGFLSKWCCSVTAFFDDCVIRPLSGRYIRPLALLVGYVLMGLWFGMTLGNVIMGIWVAVFVLIEEKYLQHIDIGSAGLLGVLAIFLFHFFYAFSTGSRLLTAAKGLFGLNRNGFWNGDVLDFLPGALPLLILCLCFCLPLGTMLRNIWYNKFKGSGSMLTLSLVWEAVYPLVLLVFTLICVFMGKTPFMTL